MKKTEIIQIEKKITFYEKFSEFHLSLHSKLNVIFYKIECENHTKSSVKTIQNQVQKLCEKF